MFTLKDISQPLWMENHNHEHTDEESLYLAAAASGDVGVVRQFVDSNEVNVNCVDFMGRTALHLAVENDHQDVVEVLLTNMAFASFWDAVLHAISKSSVSILLTIIDHPSYIAGEENLKRLGRGVVDHSDSFFCKDHHQFGDSRYTADITPLILACHYNNHEIIQILMSRGHRIETPHEYACKCSQCVAKYNFDPLKLSLSRLNAYRALASPAYMTLSSQDPILTSFELRQKLKKLALEETEFKVEYLALVDQCMNFAYEMMDLCRGTQEVETVLSEGSDTVARLKMAIRYEEKKFVAHPNCQQYLNTLWYGKEMFMMVSRSWPTKLLIMLAVTPLVPVICVIYLLAPKSRIGSLMRCPCVKFMNHTISYLIFLVLLALSSFNRDDQTTHGDDHMRHKNYTVVKCLIIAWIIGQLVEECKKVHRMPIADYVSDSINIMDSLILSLYIASYVLSIMAMQMVHCARDYYNITMYSGNKFKCFTKPQTIEERRHLYFIGPSRFIWEPHDPEIISEVLFAVANVMNFARMMYLMPMIEVLGQLQISLGRMLGDITRFICLFTLVLFAFMVGVRNLYWYYGPSTVAFQSIDTTMATFFWAIFGLTNLTEIRHIGKPGEIKGFISTTSSSQEIYCLDNIPTTVDTDASLAVIKGVGTCMFAVYSVLVVIILINMLIAMMSHSFEAVQIRREAVVKQFNIGTGADTTYEEIAHQLARRYLHKLELSTAKAEIESTLSKEVHGVPSITKRSSKRLAGIPPGVPLSNTLSTGSSCGSTKSLLESPVFTLLNNEDIQTATSIMPCGLDCQRRLDEIHKCLMLMDVRLQYIQKNAKLIEGIADNSGQIFKLVQRTNEVLNDLNPMYSKIDGFNERDDRLLDSTAALKSPIQRIKKSIKSFPFGKTDANEGDTTTIRKSPIQRIRGSFKAFQFGKKDTKKDDESNAGATLLSVPPIKYRSHDTGHKAAQGFATLKTGTVECGTSPKSGRRVGKADFVDTVISVDTEQGSKGKADGV